MKKYYNLKDVLKKWESYCELNNIFGLYKCDGYYDNETGEYIPESTTFYVSNAKESEFSYSNSRIEFKHEWYNMIWSAIEPEFYYGDDYANSIVNNFYEDLIKQAEGE